MTPIEYIIVGIAILLLLSIIASKASGLIGVPSLLIFLLIGMLAGSEGPGGIRFDDPWVAQFIGVLALTFILFAGGIETNWQSVRPILSEGISLSTVGVLLTALLLGLAATQIIGLSLMEGLLLGAIVSSTDAAAVFSVLRSKKVSLRGNLKPLLELESGSNDPMAVFLTTGIIGLLINQTASGLSLVWFFVLQMTIGTIIGFGMGKAMTSIINRLRLEYEGLYPVLTITLVLLVYGVTASVGGNGFLAVYLAGVVLGNSNFIHKQSLVRFHDGLAWLMQIAMFLTLGLLVFPSRLVPIIGVGLAVSAFLMFVARPFSIFIVLSLSRLAIRDKAIVSWVGLRGAVPIILATFPLLAGIPRAEQIFNIVFFVVLTSALLQGTSIPYIARWLRVDRPAKEKPRYPLQFEPTSKMQGDLVELVIPNNSPAIGRRILDLSLQKGALIVLISRDQEFIVPNGGTIIEAGDRMLVLADKTARDQMAALISPPTSE